MKKLTTAKLKKKLDAVFSQYMRLKYADKNGMVTCYTCGKVASWKEMQNGHFVNRQHLATRFDEDNCRVQCVGCNMWGKGQVAKFGYKLEEELGAGTINRLYRKAQEITKYFPYEEKILFYQTKLKEYDILN